MRKSILAAGSSALLLAGCQTTNPGPGADMRYKLPRTDAQATLSLTLVDCATLAVEPELKLAAKPGAQPTVYTIPGEVLASSRIKRGLKITTSELGVIKTINSDVSERTPQIVGNVVKTAALIAGTVLAANNSTPLTCTAKTAAAVARAKRIDQQIVALRANLAAPAKGGGNAAPTTAERQAIKDIAALAEERGTLDALVRVDVSAKIPIDAPGQDLTADLPVAAFENWFDTSPDQAEITQKFGLSWTIETVATTEARLAVDRRRDLRACGLSITVPSVTPVKLTVKGRGSQVQGVEEALVTNVAQLTPGGAQLCVDAARGETRSVGLTFDANGAVTDYAWSSDATAETISGAVAGAAPDALSLYTAAKGKSALETDKAEIDALETGQKLRALRACQAILDAGGSCAE